MLSARKIVRANVYRLRQKQKMSQQDLAIKAGVDRVCISEIEGGRTNPKLDTLERIANALGITLADLLKDQA